MDTSLPAILGLGFLLGIRHAMDADHVAAVSAIVSQHRSVLRSCMLGTFWGIGHELALLGAGLALISLKLTISPGVERALETTTACVLIILGVHVLLKLPVGSVNVHADAGIASHRHYLHTRVARYHRLVVRGWRPLLLGVLHGLAGSAALMLLVLGSMPSSATAILYIAVFGVGSIVGMLVLSGVIGIPFALAVGRSTAAQAVVQSVAGTASVIVGVILIWRLAA